MWNGVFHNDFGKVKWIQFDVGQGDAALLRLPRGKTILIDGGPKRPHYDNGERVIAPYLRKSGIKKVDSIILTHPHSDHLGGLLYILNHFQVGEVITAGSEYDSKIHTDFQEIIQKRNISHRIVTAPDSLIEFPGIKLYFLSPTEKRKSMASNLNNQSLVLGLYYGESKMFFMGDAERGVEEEMIQLYKNLDCDLIKAGHHGSFTSNTESFLNIVTPDKAIISVGATNRFRHPSKSCINRLMEKDIGIHRTDIAGAVIFQTDGKKIEKIRWR